MRTALGIVTALVLPLRIATAEAADSMLFAETGGFLLGNAHRCGVPIERIDRVGGVIHDLIVAAAQDSTEVSASDSRLAEIFLASAVPQQDRSALVASCPAVITQFERLERHYQEAGMIKENRIGRSDFEDSPASE